MTKTEILEAASHPYGAFVSTDGSWSSTRNPVEFAEMLRQIGFEVIDCYETAYSTAIAITKCGLQIAWNGYCGVWEGL